MNRIKSGIPGFDELIEGGFPEGSSTLLSGGAGTGKSIFCLEYLYYGAKELREPSVYITLEEGPHNLWWNMQRFKWDLLPLERENLLKIYKFEPNENMDLNAGTQIKKIVDKARDLQAKRLVIDSVTAFTFWFADPAKIRFGLYTLTEELRKLNCTTILTTEVSGKRDEYSRFGVEEFLADGLVMLYYFPPKRSVWVRKMRGTKHDMNIHPMQITELGMEINPHENVAWDDVV